MKSILKIIWPLLMFSSVLFAQTDAAKVRKAIQNLDQRITYLQNLAQKYGDQRILQTVTKAKEALEKAKDALSSYQQYPLPQKLLEAWGEFKKAKGLADLAAKVLLFKPLAGAKRDFEQLLQRAEAAVQRTENAEARYMLIRARKFQKKATRAYQARELIRGSEFQRIATYFANKALEFTQASGQDGRSENTYRELSAHLKRLYKTVFSSSNNTPNIIRLLDNADSYLKQSKKYFDQGDARQAMLRLQIGERLLYRALDLQQSSGEGAQEQLRSNLNSLHSYLAGVGRMLEKSASGQGKRLLQKARRFANAAHRDFENGNLKEAQTKISLSQRLATKAMRFTSADTENNDRLIKDRLREIKRIFALQKEKNNGKSRLVSQLLDEDERLIESAGEAIASEQIAVASWQLRIAFRIAWRIDALLSNELQEPVEIKNIGRTLAEHQKVLNALSAKTQLSKKLANEVSFLQELLRKAQKNLNSGNAQLARELSGLIGKQLNLLLKEALQN